MVDGSTLKTCRRRVEAGLFAHATTEGLDVDSGRGPATDEQVTRVVVLGPAAIRVEVKWVAFCDAPIRDGKPPASSSRRGHSLRTPPKMGGHKSRWLDRIGENCEDPERFL